MNMSRLKFHSCARDATQWYTCLVCVRSWGPSPGLQTHESYTLKSSVTVMFT